MENKHSNRKYKKSHKLLVDLFAIMHPTKKENIVIREDMKIVVIYPRRIGDCVMVIPLLHQLRKEHIELTVVGPIYLKNFLNDQNLYDYFIDFGRCEGPVSGREWLNNRADIRKTLNQLKKRKYDVVMEPFGDAWATMFARMVPARYYAGVGFGNLYKLCSSIAVYDDDAHIVDLLLDVYRSIGGVVDDTMINPQIISTVSWEEKQKEYKRNLGIKDKFVLGIHCGASTDIKRWRGYAQLIHSLNEKYNIFFALYGAKEDLDDLNNIVKESGLKDNYHVFQLGMRDYIDALNLSDFIVCNDSSCGHLAVAQGIECAVIYGPYLPVMGTPRGDVDVILFSKNLECKPCASFECKYGDDVKCLNAITSDEVFKVISNKINCKMVNKM